MKLKKRLWFNMQTKRFVKKFKNKNSKYNVLIYPKLFKSNKNFVKVCFECDVKSNTFPILKIVSTNREEIGSVMANSTSIIDISNIKNYFVSIYVPEECDFVINKLEIDLYDNDEELFDCFKSDILIVTPSYPSIDNKYQCAFVHSRLKEYKKAGLDVDVISCYDYKGVSKYTFEDVEVIKANYYYLRKLLNAKKYKKILVHFFDENYANVFDSVDLTKTNLYLYLHGAEILYREYSKFAQPYFKNEEIESPNKYLFERKDDVFKKYNELENVKWIFVSEIVKNDSEKLLNIKFNNYEIIPNIIDEKQFNYVEKEPELRKKIFLIKKFSNDNCYAIDIAVRTILELSRRPFFEDIDIDIYGDGEMFDILTKPLLSIKNVHLNKGFLTHAQIKEIHDSHGIALMPTRFDTQGVSLCEAASSGCAIVTSNISANINHFGNKLDILCEVENYVEYADVIEKMYYDIDYFKKISIEVSKAVQEKYSYKQTIEKEIKTFSSESNCEFIIDKIVDNPILTIIVPSYNVEKYLWNTVMSLINHKNASKMEILIINDGSKDNTSEIGLELEKLTTIKNKSIVKIINKENGGHGSTINRGIELAKGKYVKIVDGDDTVDSKQMEKLVDILENEDSDVVLNNYIEDYALTNTINYKRLYEFMIPGLKYNFEDLCYEGYGFYKWGPILSCSTYKLDMLKRANFKLSEKCFYVDMELNTYVTINANTIVYYPLDLYRYLLGRADQSVSRKSYARNYKDHEKVTMNLIKILRDNSSIISEIRKKYISERLIYVMIDSQYLVTTYFLKNGKGFREFERRLKPFPEYNEFINVNNNHLKFHRLTKGIFIRYSDFLSFAKRIIKKILRRNR